MEPKNAGSVKRCYQHALGLFSYQFKDEGIEIFVTERFDWVEANENLYVDFRIIGTDTKTSFAVASLIKETSANYFVLNFPDAFAKAKAEEIELVFFCPVHSGESGTTILVKC